MKKLLMLGTCLALLGTLGLTSGCGQKEKPSKEEPKTEKSGKKGKDEHAHGSGPHGGPVADWGGGKYHVEFKVDHDKQEATVYVLGSDEKTPAPIKAKDGEISLSIKEPAFKVSLKASPLKGETDGAASRFVGNHKSLGIVREFEGTITGVVEGTPYTGSFKEEPETK